MDCFYFARHLCRSCTHLDVPYDEQVRMKQNHVADVLAGHVREEAWMPPVTSATSGFRNKVKLAVGGSLAAPILGITGRDGAGVDLRECPIQERAIWAIVPDLAGFVTYAGLTPYAVDQRHGELKFVIVTANTVGELSVRFVLRSTELLPALHSGLPALLARLPQIVTVSANLHPEHKAVVEGAEEIPLTPRESLDARFGDVTLHLRHHSFAQTNTPVAGELYRQAARWADDVGASHVLDVYCGVGGFALHLAGGPESTRRVHGVEIESDAIASAQLSARTLGLSERVTFAVGDADALSTGAGASTPDLVVVNPPRRGIGALAERLDDSGVPTIIYSSCNPATLARDLAAMPGYRVHEARLFDMFPHTDHAEVAVLMRRR